MKGYTFQQLSESGSFGSPDGTEVLHAETVRALRYRLEDWACLHHRVGADVSDARLMVWKGRLQDVTDVYPDFELRYGPRGGIVKEGL